MNKDTVWINYISLGTTDFGTNDYASPNVANQTMWHKMDESLTVTLSKPTVGGGIKALSNSGQTLRLWHQNGIISPIPSDYLYESVVKCRIEALGSGSGGGTLDGYIGLVVHPYESGSAPNRRYGPSIMIVFDTYAGAFKIAVANTYAGNLFDGNTVLTSVSCSVSNNVKHVWDMSVYCINNGGVIYLRAVLTCDGVLKATTPWVTDTVNFNTGHLTEWAIHPFLQCANAGYWIVNSINMVKS